MSVTSVTCNLNTKKKKKSEKAKMNMGFRKYAANISNSSCITNLLRMVDIIQERVDWVDCNYLDLKRAFGKVPLR